MALYGEPQWAVVGDTFPVGCAPGKSVVFADTTYKQNPDLLDPVIRLVNKHKQKLIYVMYSMPFITLYIRDFLHTYDWKWHKKLFELRMMAKKLIEYVLQLAITNIL